MSTDSHVCTRANGLGFGGTEEYGPWCGMRPGRPADPPAATARTRQAVRGEGGLNGRHCAVRPKAAQGVQQPGSMSRRGHVPHAGKAFRKIIACPVLTPPGGSGSALGDPRGGGSGRVRVRPLGRPGPDSGHSARRPRGGRWGGEERCTPSGGGRERAGGATIGAFTRPATAAARRARGGDGSGLGDRTSPHRARRQGGEGAVRPASLSIQHGASGAPRW